MTLDLRFAGWFQVRLATDPDPTDERRGVSGYSFALPGEPDLDRIVRLQDPVAPRSHGPAVGVRVQQVLLGGRPVPGHALEAARVNLLGKARFEMRNYVLTDGNAGTEAIDPFHIEFAAPAVTLRRVDHLDPARPGLAITEVPLPLLQRRGGAVQLDLGMFREVTGLPDCLTYRRRRRDLLQADLQGASDPVARAALGKRLSELGIEDPRDRRVLALSFKESRAFALNGSVEVVGNAAALGARIDPQADWPIRFWNGVWDCDALCGYMSGTLSIPTLGS